jgi:fibronectin-binding autotransporter adhesin
MNSSVKVRKSFRSRLRRRAQFLAILLGTIPAAGQALAQTSYWSATVGGNWGTASLWSTNATGGAGGVAANITRNAVFNTTGNNNLLTVTLAANQAALGITVDNTAGMNFRGNATGTTVRSLTIGANGITVNAGAGAVGMNASGTTSGQTNTLLLSSQTWTNNSANTLNWTSRLVGHESTTLTKAGTGTLILGSANDGVNASVNGTTVTGFRGKIVISQGLVVTGNATSLGVRDAQTTEMTSAAAIAGLISDTQILSGATLNTNNVTIGSEFVRFEGFGSDGLGAIVNRTTTTGNANAILPQVAMTGDASIGGTSRFDFRAATAGEGRFFQDGFTLTKTGTNIVGIVNNEVIGGGNIDVAQGTLRFEGSTNLGGTGTVTVQSGANIGFNNNSGSITRPFSLQGTNVVTHDAVDAISNIASAFTIAPGGGQVTFNVTDNNNATQQGTFNLNGGLTSSQDLIKVGSGRLGLTLDGANFTAANINVQGGSVDLNTISPIVANITLSDSNSTVGSIFRVGVGGEGQTTGTLSLGPNGGNVMTFDGSTTGPNQHLRVGSYNSSGNILATRLKSPIPATTGIVVLESTNPLATPGDDVLLQFSFQGRGTLSYNGTANQVLLDYAPGQMVWRGNDGLEPTFWDVQATTNWTNSGPVVGNNTQYYDGDIVTFDDTVGGGSLTVVPINEVAPGGLVFNNNTVNYLIGGSTAGVLAASQVSLTKSGTGVATISTAVGGLGHVIGQTTVNAGVLEMAFNNPGNASTAAAITSTLGTNSNTVINSGGTLRNFINVNNSGFGANPVTINAGGVLDFTRGSIPNGTNNAPAAAAIANALSGAGDVVLRGTDDVSPLDSRFTDTYGAYTINGNNAGFSGRFVLDNARIAADNGTGGVVDELGTARVIAPSGSQILLQGAAAVHGGNVYEIAGTGWTYEPTANGAFGALRLGTTGVEIGSTSSVLLAADNTRIGAQNVTGRINAVIDDGVNSYNLQIGNPTATQNGTLILGAANTYGGATNIENHAIMVNNNNAFSTGQVNLNGYTSARTTFISVGNGINVSNPINMSTFAGQGGSRGAIEGGRNQQVNDLGAGVGEYSGPVNITGGLVNTWAHFSAGEGVGSALKVSGVVTAPAGVPVQARSQNVGGYVEFSNTANSFTQFDLALGTVRLGANNALPSGVELITRRVADVVGVAQGVFDMRDFNQTVSNVTRSGTLTTATFNLVNTGTGTSTLTIQGTANSDIQNILAGPNGGVVDIVKNGSGNLVLSGSNLGNTGTYTINGGNLSITSGNVAAAVNITNAGTVISGGGTISGAVTLPSGGISFSPGSSPGTLTFASPITLPSSGNTFEWEIFNASTGGTTPPVVPPTLGTPGTDYDQIVFNGGVDLSGVNSGGFTVNVVGLSGLPSTQGIVQNFDNTKNYAWRLFTGTGITGFDPNDFVINTTSFTNNNPIILGGSFSVAQIGNEVVLQYTAVPEPSSLVLVACLSLGAIAHRSRRSRKETSEDTLS